jgi:hypothetical protein
MYSCNNKKQDHPNLKNRPLVYYCGTNAEEVTNTVFLLAAYLLVVHTHTPEQAFAPFTKIKNLPLIPFRDATYCESTYDVLILDCLKVYQVTYVW